MMQKANPVTLTSYSSPKGRYHHPLNPLNLLNPLNPGHKVALWRYHNPQRRRRCRPLSEATQPFYTTRGESRAPLF